MADRGKFIVFEGLDASGKSTQMQLLYNHMAEVCQKRGCIFTCEPTDGPVGLLLRSALTKSICLLPDTLAMLFAADRREHVAQLLETLESGTHVLCDRYYFSNLAYQSDTVPMDRLLTYNSAAMDLLRPDLTIYLDTTPEYCVKKISESRDAPELFENYDKLCHTREAFFKAFDLLKDRENILIITPMETKQETAKWLWEKLKAEFFTEEDLK